MVIAGFHGTSFDNANSIIKDSFLPSTGNKHWLGDGIYFYPDISDAFNWSGKPSEHAEAVVFAVLCFDDDEILDLDSNEGKIVFEETKKIMLSGLDNYNGKKVTFSKDIQENQCIIMNEIWKAAPEIKVIMGSFREGERAVKTLTDTRRVRREFCVRSNNYIRYKHMLKRGDLDG